MLLPTAPTMTSEAVCRVINSGSVWLSNLLLLLAVAQCQSCLVCFLSCEMGLYHLALQG